MPQLHKDSKLKIPSTHTASSSMRQASKKKSKRSAPDPTAGLSITHPNAAGIDVGGDTHWVALPPDRAPQTVRTFGCFTTELEALAQWLIEHRIDTVVMESTGIYWVSLYDILERHGLRVFLINARLAKKLLSRKTDLLDCQWLQRLHAYGLLNNSFRPPEQIRVLRAYLRLRERAVAAASQCVQHMQKALIEMNVQLSTVISDISGETGLRIIDAILAGERDGDKLAALKDPRIKATAKTLSLALRGHWKEEQLFALEQARLSWAHYQEQIAQCQDQIDQQLQAMNAQAHPKDCAAGAVHCSSKPAREKPAACSLREGLKQLAGVDLVSIDGIGELTAQIILSEVGTDMSPWPSEKHFSSWLALCPEHEISGGKILKRGRRRKVSQRAAQALRLSAYGLERSDSALGAKYRRLKRRLGAPKAIVALAHQLARLVYRLLKYGQDYVDRGAAWYEARYQAQRLRWLQKQAQELNLKLVPAE